MCGDNESKLTKAIKKITNSVTNVINAAKPLTKKEENIREAFLAISCFGSRMRYKAEIEAQYKASKKKIDPRVFA